MWVKHYKRSHITATLLRLVLSPFLLANLISSRREITTNQNDEFQSIMCRHPLMLKFRNIYQPIIICHELSSIALAVKYIIQGLYNKAGFGKLANFVLFIRFPMSSNNKFSSLQLFGVYYIIDGDMACQTGWSALIYLPI